MLNLTGVVIHTNLGRAPLSEAAIQQVTRVARSYSNLEYDLEAGARGNRETHLEALLTRLTGAEAAFAVNNNAAAVLLLLMALAPGREVLVSRGQLVEIGGSFRLPDIMRAGGVRLVEVGTTNRTRIGDYEAAITPDTAMLLRVHTSNYRIMGFAEEAELSELVELGRRRGVIVADDLGSGALHDLDAYRGEPTVAASLRAGVDVVCFSGDKLLGGPQAGILVGRREIVGRLRKHPVARALRLDKMTLAALEATLRAYQDPELVRRDIPVLRSLTRTPAETAPLAAALMAAIDRRTPGGFITEVEETSARAGGGSMPLTEVPSHAVRMRFPEPPIPGDVPGGSARPAGAAGGPGGSTGEETLDDRRRADRRRLGSGAAPGAGPGDRPGVPGQPAPGRAGARRARSGGCGRQRCLGHRPGSPPILGTGDVMAGPPMAEPSAAGGHAAAPPRPLTLGTAGHIDHGKTTLVKALTGRDTDRLKEEKERGISIELGFAELALPSGRHLSVVDVPGHERFVKTMVAGATGIDLFLLVVAADDGVMPQTREHLRIIELLGIPAGVVALTKVDMVDPELAELAKADAEEFLASTRYAGAPMVMVSGVTGEGLPELLAELDRAGRPGAGPARIPRHADARGPGLLSARHRHGGHGDALVGDAQR